MNNKYFTQADIEALPDEWKLLPANGSKTPVDPITGRPLKKWTEADYTADDIKKMVSPHVKAVSVLTGERSGLVVIDVDAEEGKQTFSQIFGMPIEELPATLINTSGKPGSRKYYFHVSQEQAIWFGLCASQQAGHPLEREAGGGAWEASLYRLIPVGRGTFPLRNQHCRSTGMVA